MFACGKVAPRPAGLPCQGKGRSPNDGQGREAAPAGIPSTQQGNVPIGLAMGGGWQGAGGFGQGGVGEWPRRLPGAA